MVIVNLGSPDTPSHKDIGTFLTAFLSDRRVVHWPRWLWLPILHGIVRRVRPGKIKPVYESIWMGDKAPLVHYTLAQHRGLEQALPSVSVKYAMAYTKPSIDQALGEFDAEGVTDVTVISLYPQYAPSTVAAITDQVFRHYSKAKRVPNLHIISDFPTHPIYIDWYARNIADEITSRRLASGVNPSLHTRDVSASGVLADDDHAHTGNPGAAAIHTCPSPGASAGNREQAPIDRVVFSFHGVPNHELHQPDLYRRQCLSTVDAILNHPAMATLDVDHQVTFQSKFGPGEWIGPATIDEMARIPGEDGVKSVLVCTPGFIADCIETLDEIDVLNRQAFMDAGGQSFTYLNPMNDAPAVTELLVDLYQSVHQ